MAMGNYVARIGVESAGIGLFCGVLSGNAFAHCDTLNNELTRSTPQPKGSLWALRYLATC